MLAQELPSLKSLRRLVTIGKRMFYKHLEMGLEGAYQYAAEEMACNMMAEDAGEGIDAFVGKRPPEWKNR